MSVPPELRVTDRDVNLSCRYPTCRTCGNRANRADGDCPGCEGWGTEETGYGVRLGYHASTRLGAMLAEGLRWTAPWWDVSTW